jgi:hypothetical protein
MLAWTKKILKELRKLSLLVLNYLFLLQKCGPEWVDDFGAATKLGRTKKQQQQQLAKPSQNGGTRLKN